MDGTSKTGRYGMLLALGGGLLVAVSFSPGNLALGDPCGMVPPIRVGDGTTPAIERIDVQRTYVCFDRGVESIVLRPAFRGRVDDFGMLIPFPQPPEIRKVDDRIFQHIAAAIDPPEVTIDLTPRQFGGGFGGGGFGGGGIGGRPPKGNSRERGFGGLGVIKKDEVAVLKREAVGMYEVAVLAAGSAESLNKWMTDNGYRYPTGMDEICNEYIEQLWGFVAVKTHVAAKSQVDPQPGQRTIDARLPTGAGFEGHVQAMGFRFHSEEFVVPMRLSAFNEGSLRNVVYLLSKGPKAIRNIPEEYVVRQIAGKQLVKNCTQLLPLRVIGGEITNGRVANGRLIAGKFDNLSEAKLQEAKPLRDPTPHNGLALDLFTSDLLAIGRDELLIPHEGRRTMLSNISVRLGINDAELSHLYHVEPKEGEELDAYEDAQDWLSRMTLTVVDGDFPREVLASDNLHFRRFRMPGRLNHRTHYDATRDGPGSHRGGVLIANVEISSSTEQHRSLLESVAIAFAGVIALGLVIHRLQRRSRRS